MFAVFLNERLKEKQILTFLLILTLKLSLNKKFCTAFCNKNNQMKNQIRV